jgi:hypothetical protein
MSSTLEAYAREFVLFADQARTEGLTKSFLFHKGLSTQLLNKIDNFVEKDFNDLPCHTQQVAARVSISSDDQKTVRVAQLTDDTTTRQDEVVCAVGTAEQSRTYGD